VRRHVPEIFPETNRFTIVAGRKTAAHNNPQADGFNFPPLVLSLKELHELAEVVSVHIRHSTEVHPIAPPEEDAVPLR
jgi:hypothetical protein